MWTALWEHGWQPVQWGVVVVASVIAAAIDVRTHRIPNRLTGPLLMLGLIWAAAVAGVPGIVDGLLAVLLVGLPFLAMWLLRAGGAGDAKMMMAVGAWLGVLNGLAAMLAVAIAGGIVAGGFMLARRQARSAVGNLFLIIYGSLFLIRGGGRFSDRQKLLPSIHSPQAIPYGLAICAGVCAAAVSVTIWRG